MCASRHALIIVTIIICRFLFSHCHENLDFNEVWCQNEGWDDTSIRPFKVLFSEKMIKDLKNRLKHNRLSEPNLPGVGFEYGFNTREMPYWTDYWANQYPFKDREAYFNQMPQFKTKIQGMDIHFIRVTPKSACRPGLDAVKMAVVMRNLMHRLGHKKFYVQGGDWGAFIGANLATLFQNEVLGYHTNLAVSLAYNGLFLYMAGSLSPPLVVSPSLAHRMYPLMDKLLELLRETGYLFIQSTKPNTIGIGLSDSPSGLLAYIFQIFSSGAESCNINKEDGGLHNYPKYALIDNLMMYWASNSITTSFRIYTETLNKQFSTELLNIPTKVPTWALQSQFEMTYQPSSILKTKFPNLLNATVLSEGGHFLALELPKAFSDDVLSAVGEFRKQRDSAQ